MDFKKIALGAGGVALALALAAAWLWQPERQVRRQTGHLLRAVEKRDWDQMQEFLADNYADRWGHDKEFVRREMREVFRQFLFLTVQNETLSCQIEGPIGTTQTCVKILGSGGPVAQMVIEKVNELREPFTFSWAKQSWKPWDWRLIRIEQAELNLEMPATF